MTEPAATTTTDRSEAAGRLDPLIGSFTRTVGEDEGYWSPELYEMFGVPDTYPSTWTALIALVHPEDRNQFSARETRWGEDDRLGRSHTFAHGFRLMRPDGRVRMIDVRGWVRPGEPGQPAQAQGFCRDITDVGAIQRERRHLAQQREMLLDTAGEPVCGIDDRGRVLFATPELAEMVGRPPGELVGHPLHALVHDVAEHTPEACPYLPARLDPTGLDEAVLTATGPERLAYVASLQGGPPATAAVIRFVRPGGAASARLSAHAAAQTRLLRADRDRLAEALAAAEESERLRIAGDLHDDTVQALSAVVLDLRMSMEELDGPAREALSFAADQISDAKLRLRQLMYELLPPPPDEVLREAVAGYCHSILADGEILYEISGDPRDLPIHVYVAAYRLIQEALRNVVKHARSTRVRVDLHRTGDVFVCRVSDDGVGLEHGATASSGHAGLEILRQRAQAVGGFAVLGSGLQGRGVSVELRLPLDREPLGLALNRETLREAR